MVPSYVQAWGIGQKSPLGPCVGWANLYSHFNCGWLGQSMLLFPLPYLGRFLGNNLLTLGQDVRPCAWKASSFQKSTLICRSSYSNWTSLDATKMQAALQLWYWIPMPFGIAHFYSNSRLFSISSFVEVNLILAKLFHITITTYLHYNMHTSIISTLILNTPNPIVH
jgi:hypothetical protein